MMFTVKRIREHSELIRLASNPLSQISWTKFDDIVSYMWIVWWMVVEDGELRIDHPTDE